MAEEVLGNWDKAFNALDGITEGLKKKHPTLATELRTLMAHIRAVQQSQIITAIQTDEMARAWGKVTAALRSELNVVQLQHANDMIRSRAATVLQALDNVDWLRDFARVAETEGRALADVAKNAGNLFVGLELLIKASIPDVTSLEMGKTAFSAGAGLIVGAVLVATTWPAWVVAGFAIGAGLLAEKVFEDYIALSFGLDESTTDTFRNDVLRTIEILSTRDTRVTDPAYALDIMRKVVLNQTDSTPLNDVYLFSERLFQVSQAVRIRNPQGIGVIRLIDTPATAISQLAAQPGAIGDAYRYALRELHAIVITGLDYAQHNGDGSLNLAEVSLDQGMTKQYLDDRANMLYWTIKRNVANNVGAISGGPGVQGMHFKDVKSGIEFDLGLPDNVVEKRQTQFGGSGADPLTGKKLEDHLYGGGGDDTLDGKAGNDYLEGNTGEDKLDGGDGTDVLKGGEGNDTYTLRASDSGMDTVLDSDGLGIIKAIITGGSVVVLGGGTIKKIVNGSSANVGTWQSEDKRFTYTTRAEADNSLTLSISGAGINAVVKNFTSGNLGITLPGSVVSPTVPTPSQQILGDLAPLDTNPAEEGVQTQVDALGNVLVDSSQPSPNRADGLYDSAGDDEIISGGGSDGIDAMRGGNDWIKSGAGNDIVYGGAGDDLIELGTDRDYGYGGAGDDRIYANALIAIDEVLAQAVAAPDDQGNVIHGEGGDDILVGDAAKDELYGGQGKDFLVGGAGEDIMSGGGGDDLLLGGSGSDQLDGDGGLRFIQKPDYTAAAEHGNDYLDGGAGRDILNGGGGADTLLGGDDGDWIFGDEALAAATEGYLEGQFHGNDYLDGGAGDDYIEGNGGNDIIFGGEGHDNIWADAAASRKLLGEFHGTDYVDGGAGDDNIGGGGGDDILYGGGGNDVLSGDQAEGGNPADLVLAGNFHGKDYLDGGLGHDFLLGGGRDDTLIGGEGSDKLYGDEWETFLAGQYHGKDYLDGGEGGDELYGGGSDDFLYGGAGSDLLYGDDKLENLAAGFHGNDFLDGGDGNDSLYGGGGNDTLIGGAGNDVLDGGEGDDKIEAGAGDRVEDEKGANALTLADGEPITVTASGSDLVLGYTTGNLLIKGGLKGSMSTIAGQSASAWLQGRLTDDINLTSSQSGETLLGGSGNDQLNAVHGNTTLNGGAGNDQLNGSDEDDVLIGGSGSNTLYAGAGNDVLTSSGQTDYLNGGEGNNIYRITNEAGRVTIASRLGLGSDTLLLSGSPETTLVKTSRTDENLIFSIFVAGLDAEGNQTLLAGPVVTLVGYFYLSGDEANTFKGLSFESGEYVTVDQLLLSAATGTEGDDDLYGSSGADILVALDGNDQLHGFDGDDLLDGGAGNDVLEGGYGTDTLYGGTGDDRLAGGNGDDTVSGGEGADELIGGEGDDMLDAGAGNDVLAGGLGNDGLAGGAGDDSLNGGDGDDVINGGDGNDILLAGKGNDVLTGGAGMDTYVLGYGMNRVTIVDDSAEGSVIQLDESGLNLQNLAAKRSSNDLLIEIRGTDSSFRIKDYYIATQTSWTLKDAAGNSLSAQALIDASTPQWGSLQASLLQEFKATARSAIGAQYVALGYVRQADGTWFLPNGFAQYGSATFSNESYEQKREYSYTHRYIDAPPEDSWVTKNSVVFGTSWTKNQWPTIDAQARDTLISIEDQASTVSDTSITLNNLTNAATTETAWSAVTGWNAYYTYSYVGSWSFPHTVVSPPYAPGEIITEQSRAVETRRSYYGSGAPLTFDAPAAVALAGPLPSWIAVRLTHEYLNYNLGPTTLSDGDHTVNANAYSAVIGGVGNNVIYGAGFAYGGTGNGALIGGDILMAGTGDQYLENGRIMAVGDGHTTVVGRASGRVYNDEHGRQVYDQANTTILIDPNNTGVDLLVSDSSLWSDRNNNYYDDAVEAIYKSRGITNPQESFACGGMFKLYIVEAYLGYFETRDEALAMYNRFNTGVSFDDSVTFIRPLTELISAMGQYDPESWDEPSAYYLTHPINTVLLTANNFHVLQPYVNEGLVPSKIVSFGLGLGLEDISLSWGSAISPIDGSSHVTLDLMWGEAQGVRVMIPHFDDAIGGTISSFQFADGSVISLPELIALAPPAPHFDAGFSQLHPGSGAQIVDAVSTRGIYVNSMAIQDVLVESEGTDLILSLNNGQDSLRLTGWYSDRDNYADIFLQAGSGHVVSSGELSARGLLKDASSGNVTVYGVPDFGTTFIAGPNTVLVGMSDDDTFVYGAGTGVVHIADQGNGTLRFGAGITSEMVSMGPGTNSLVLTIGNQGDVIHLDGFDPDDAENFLSVQNLEFADGTELDFYDLFEQGFDIHGSAGDDVLSGTSITDRFYASAGDDTLLGRAGDDTYQVNSAGDVVVELADEGEDWIESSVTFTLSDNVEGILLTGNNNIDATGNDLYNELYGNSGDNVLNGGAGGDVLRGGAGNDTAIGGSGDDEIYGEDGDDTLDGGTGSDYLEGGAGNDVYLFQRGDGTDEIEEEDSTAGNMDTVRFGSGIVAADIRVTRDSSSNLHLSIVGTTDDIQLSDWFGDDSRKVERVEFADGTVWSQQDLVALAVFGGSEGGDYLYGTENGDILQGRGGADELDGGDGDDTLDGGAGNDYLLGGAGNDVYLFGRGSGQDYISDYDETEGNVDTIRFDATVSVSDVRVTRDQYSLYLSIDGTDDQIWIYDWFGNESKVEQVEFADGTVWNQADLAAMAIFVGTEGDDILFGDDGNNTLMGLEGNDLFFGGIGNDSLFGGAGNDVHNGGEDSDTLSSGAGNDILIGGLGADSLNAGDGNDLLVGGAGDDTISTGIGADVIAFNEGDGQDTILASTTQDNTLSLGHGIEYSELAFSKFGNDLVLDTGSGDKLTFKDWYTHSTNHSVANLQMVIDGGADYDSSSQSDLHNKKIVQFDLDGLVNSFDQALIQNPGLTSWALSSALTSFHLSSSDTSAIGGDLSYEYAKSNTLSGISIDPARTILGNSQFGSAGQGLQPASNLQDSTLRIM